ncbi:MAG: ABC transporter substrate-binding protein, partial [Chloroflexi bacterium]|nr:ABC transporter substrate-binding protein [Chloroflexota bacterium]
LLTDPKYKSPYLTRWTNTITDINDPTADWAAKQGFKKASMLVPNSAAGVQIADIFASNFIRHGGTIIQEQYAPPGTADYGPFLAQLNSDADALFTFLPGIDGLRFADQYASYAGQKKPQIIDAGGTIVAGPNIAQLKDKVLGIVAVELFSEASDDPGIQAFIKAWKAAYPNRLLSNDAATGYASGQILAAALEKVNGAIENTQPFLQALYGVSLDSAKGPVKLDANHDIIEDFRVVRMIKNGDGVGKQLLTTYHDVNDTWARSADEIATFPWDSFKGKWVGMTQAQLDSALKSH